MKYNLITPADALPVSVEDARSHLMVTSTSTDALIEDLIWAATKEFENSTNECLSPQTWDLHLDASEVEEVIRFAKFPVLGITSISYFDSDNNIQNLTHSNGDYLSFVSGRPASIDFSADEVPTVYERDGAMTIRFLAGYTTLPYDIKKAVLSRVYRLYEHPDDPVSERQTYFDRIVRSYRSYGLH